MDPNRGFLKHLDIEQKKSGRAAFLAAHSQKVDDVVVPTDALK
jgi:hypothetical protein